LASRVTTFVEAVEAELNLIVAATYPNGVINTVGELARLEHGSWPRIAWVPKSSKGDAPFGAGGNPRPLWTRNIQLYAHVWAEDFERAESLFLNLVQAVHHVAAGSYAFGGETWPTEDTDADWLKDGAIVIVLFGVRMPITDVTRPVTRITDVGHTAGVENSLETGCSS
jgi:hypothetical protein